MSSEITTFSFIYLKLDDSDIDVRIALVPDHKINSMVRQCLRKPGHVQTSVIRALMDDSYNIRLSNELQFGYSIEKGGWIPYTVKVKQNEACQLIQFNAVPVSLSESKWKGYIANIYWLCLDESRVDELLLPYTNHRDTIIRTPPCQSLRMTTAMSSIPNGPRELLLVKEKDSTDTFDFSAYISNSTGKYDITRRIQLVSNPSAYLVFCSHINRTTLQCCWYAENIMIVSITARDFELDELRERNRKRKMEMSQKEQKRRKQKEEEDDEKGEMKHTSKTNTKKTVDQRRLLSGIIPC